MGEHPKRKKKVILYEGKYGPYLKMGTKNFSLPEDLKESSKALKMNPVDAFKVIDQHLKK